jgi:hypothetical protein
MCILHLGCALGAAVESDGRHSAGQGSDPQTSEDSREGLRSLDEMQVLYVMDPNSDICFEKVYIDDVAAVHLLPWVRGLRDELTRSPSNPEGEELEVKHICSRYVYSSVNHFCISRCLHYFCGSWTMSLVAVLFTLYHVMIKQ